MGKKLTEIQNNLNSIKNALTRISTFIVDQINEEKERYQDFENQLTTMLQANKTEPGSYSDEDIEDTRNLKKESLDRIGRLRELKSQTKAAKVEAQRALNALD